MKNKEKVVLFPGTKKQLETESLKALQEKKYKEALDKLDYLIQYDEGSHEIYIAKLMCLMELGNYREAEQLSEALLAQKDANYYHYLHIYLTVLFQTSQYQHLLDLLDEEFKSRHVPDMLIEPFQELYNMSQDMKAGVDENSTFENFHDLEQAVNEDDYIKQWNLVQRLRFMQADPKTEIVQLLASDQAHPVVKTNILEWLREANLEQTVRIHKFDTDMMIQPSDLAKIEDETVYNRMMKELERYVDSNPTLLTLLQKLVYRYFYVTYPFIPSKSDIPAFIEAVHALGQAYLQMDFSEAETDASIETWMNSIKMCDSLYLSIIEE